MAREYTTERGITHRLSRRHEVKMTLNNDAHQPVASNHLIMAR